MKLNLKHLSILAITLISSVGSSRYRGSILRSEYVLVHKEYGYGISMDHFKALLACPKGSRLPTVREFAMEAQARGAKGILELNQVNPGSVPEGYYKISAVNPDGKRDEFYYNYRGYVTPGGLFGEDWRVEGKIHLQAWFWSSSFKIDDPGNAHYFNRGGISDIFRTGSDECNVVCIPQ